MTASPRRRRDAKAGFLLTETLATFTMSAFVLLGLVSASSVLLRSVDRSVAQVQDVDELAQTMKAIERDVSSLARARWNGYEPQGFVFRGGPNSLFFAQARKESDGSREIHVVALREVIAGRGTRLTRGEASLSPRAVGFGDLHFGPQRELGTGFARLKFYYTRPAGEKGQLERLREWRTDRVLPAAIIVEAVARDTGQVVISTRMTIRADAEIGCLAQDNVNVSIGLLSTAATAPRNSTADIGVAANPASSQSASVTLGSGDTAMATPATFCGREDADKTKVDRPDPARQSGSSTLTSGSAR